jgi:hypothetical protein
VPSPSLLLGGVFSPTMSMAFVMNQNITICSWSEWLDVQIEQLKNGHNPIMKEDV